MSDTFVPVDLDQVLDDFEEQEKKNGSATPNNTDNPNNLLSIPHGAVRPNTRLGDAGELRTYSFNKPLDAILEEPPKSINKTCVKTLAQELADSNFRLQNNDNDSETGSETSSISAVIAAAEVIMNTNALSERTLDEGSLQDKESLFQYFENLYTEENSEKDDNVLRPNSDGIGAADIKSNLTAGITDSSDNDTNENVEQSSELAAPEVSLESKTEPGIPSDEEFTKAPSASRRDIESSYPMSSLPAHVKNFGTGKLDSTDTTDAKETRYKETSKCGNLKSEDLLEFGREDTDTVLCNAGESLLYFGEDVRTSVNSNAFHDQDVSMEGDVNSCVDEGVADIDISAEWNTNQDLGDVPTSSPVPDITSEMDKDLLNASATTFADSTANEPNSVLSETAMNDQQQVSQRRGNLQFSAEHYGGALGSPDCSEDSSAESLCETPSAVSQNFENPDSSDMTEGNDPPSPIPQMEITPGPHTTSSTAVFISSGDPEMGYVPPLWVPDDVATHCMNCGLKFSLIKRRHHCRACGKVLCSTCCNMKFPLPYLGNKEVRVCQVCCDVLLKEERQTSHTQEQTLSPEPSYASTWETTPYVNEDGQPSDPIPPTEAVANSIEEPLPPSLQEEDEAENVDDHDDVDDHDIESTVESSPSILPISPQPLLQDAGESSLVTPVSPAPSDDSDFAFRLDVEQVRALIPEDSTALPPVLNVRHKVISIQENPDPADVMYRLKGLGETVVFLLNKNLVVKVTIVKLRCCAKKKCWCFVTDGMGAASQEEMVVLLECEHSENAIPKDVLSHFNTAFAYAKQGHVVSDLGFTIFGQPFLGSANNAGFLYIKPSFQCLQNLPLPTVPYVFGILIQRPEAPWAQLFPLRLMLRLGTEFRYYPCPLWSVRNRPSVYGEIGHTIMNLLTDFKNFQYSVPRVTGLVINMEEKKTTVRLPQDRYDEIVKVLNAAEEHMFALGANFSSEADSHLVCIQEGQVYKTQAINMQNKPRQVTGASFVVFTGSLKTSNPINSKVSILEDGLMIQMVPGTILELRKALREMQDYTIKTSTSAGNFVERVCLEWASRDSRNESHTSPIDGTLFTDVPSIRVHSSCDFTRREIYRIRWTHVFLKRSGEGSSRGFSSRGLSNMTGELARACCEALRSHLPGLYESKLTCLALRVNMDSDSVEYSIGVNQQPLPADIMVDLDSALVPTMNAAAMKYGGGPLTVELFFNIIVLF